MTFSDFAELQIDQDQIRSSGAWEGHPSFQEMAAVGGNYDRHPVSLGQKSPQQAGDLFLHDTVYTVKRLF